MINTFTIQEVREFWDGVAHTYEQYNEQVGYVHTQRFEKALAFGGIEPGQRILNIWSRTGSLIPWLRKTPNLTIEHREASPKLMRIAQERYPNESFGLTDLEHLSEFDDNTFDRIISLETLEHVPKPQTFLNELQRVLKPNGLLILSLPPRGAEVPEFFYRLLFGDHGEGPHRFLWPYEVKRIAGHAQLNIVAHHPFILLPLRNNRLTRMSETILTGLFGWTPLGNFGVRHFYVYRKAENF